MHCFNRNGSRWSASPNENGTPKNLFNRWKQLRGTSVFAQIIEGFPSSTPDTRLSCTTQSNLGQDALISLAQHDSRSGKWSGDMSNLFWLTDTKMSRLAPFFPKSHGKHQLDDKRVLSGIVFIDRNGLRWRDGPREYGPHKTLYSRWRRWSETGIFARMMAGLAAEHGETTTVMIDATYLKAHRTATRMAVKRGAWSPDWSHLGRREHQIARHLRQSGTTDQLVLRRWTGQRLYRRTGAAQ